MNTEEKMDTFRKIIRHLDVYSANKKSNPPAKTELSVQLIDPSKLPQISLVEDLLSYHQQVIQTVDSTYENTQGVISQLNKLQNKKQNVNTLLDSMTAIKAVRNLSFNGLGQNPAQVFRNLSVYYSVKNKIYYCEKYTEKVEESIHEIEEEYRRNFNSELVNTNSENISDVAKVLNLIHKHSPSSKNLNANDQLAQFYMAMLKKDLQNISNELLTIPIIGNNNEYSQHPYRFFELVKVAQSSLAKIISTYKENIVKISGDEGIHTVIKKMFAFLMNQTILELLNRLKRYFEIDSMDLSTINRKQTRNKSQSFISEFYAIWNQVQRLKAHLANQISQSYEHYRLYINDIDNIINSQSLLIMSSDVIRCVQALARSSFDKLLKISPFSSSIWDLDEGFFSKIDRNKEVYESSESHEFLQKIFNIFLKLIKDSLDTYNMLIISPLVSFTNQNLIEEDCFHVFGQLFEVSMKRFPSNNTNNYTAIVLVLNCLFLLPNALKNCFLSISIPSELEQHEKRLKSQIKELVQTGEYKTKSELNRFLDRIVSAQWTKKELINDYQGFIKRWKGLETEVNETFLFKLSKMHASLIMENEFLNKNKKKSYSQGSIIELDKEIRSYIDFYTRRGSVVYSNFEKIFAYLQILEAEDEESCKQLIKKWKIENEKEIDNLWKIRSLKVT